MQREVTNFAGGNLIDSLCKIDYFPQELFVLCLFETTILLFGILIHLYRMYKFDWLSANSVVSVLAVNL